MLNPPTSAYTRREFLTASGSCAAHLALVAAVMPAPLRELWARPVGAVAAREPFGNLEKVADGVWALISTPLGGDRTTISNGGLVVGRNGVLAIEGFNQPEGAAWLAGKARELTGRWPTHVVLTHFHSDHANGVAGYLRDGAKPVVRSTELTRRQVIEKNQPADASRVAALADVVFFDRAAATTIDLGGRVVRVTPRSGHTSSDVSLSVDDPNVVFSGDLVWNAMFPNYVDAIPTQLSKSARAVRRDRSTIYVPGHGALAREPELDRYLAMIDDVETAARRAHEQGKTPQEAGAAYTPPSTLGEWVLFSKVFYERAFTAWYRELDQK
jgi:glyoxylase-like metal-dependent hydrolase (beta-lactamase superfamily II)